MPVSILEFQASSKMAERIYAQQGGAEGAAGPGPEAGGGEAGGGAAGGGAEDVVDAEFEEVKDDKK